MKKEQLSARVGVITEDLKDFISEKGMERLTAAGVEGNSLPASGVFGTYKKSGEKEFAHVRITVEGSDESVSLSNLRIVAPRKDDAIEFGKINKEGALKGKLYLKGKTINPKFAQLSGVELIAYLEGKKFTAKPVEVMQLTFKETGYATESEAKKALVVKQAFEVSIEE